MDPIKRSLRAHQSKSRVWIFSHQSNQGHTTKPPGWSTTQVYLGFSFKRSVKMRQGRIFVIYNNPSKMALASSVWIHFWCPRSFRFTFSSLLVFQKMMIFRPLENLGNSKKLIYPGCLERRRSREDNDTLYLTRRFFNP